MELVVIVAISVLACVCTAAFFLALGLFIHHMRKRRADYFSRALNDERPEVTLVEHAEEGESVVPVVVEERGDGSMELVELSPQVQALIADSRWLHDAQGLVPHCIAILKTCHMLTDRLVALTVNQGRQVSTMETLTDVVVLARRIGPRVDQVVQSMYPPVDPLLLEARCTALVLSVSHLALTTKSACNHAELQDWIEQSLSDVEEHLKVLRQVCEGLETSPSPPSSPLIGATAFPGADNIQTGIGIANSSPSTSGVSSTSDDITASSPFPPTPITPGAGAMGFEDSFVAGRTEGNFDNSAFSSTPNRRHILLGGRQNTTFVPDRQDSVNCTPPGRQQDSFTTSRPDTSFATAKEDDFESSCTSKKKSFVSCHVAEEKEGGDGSVSDSSLSNKLPDIQMGLDKVQQVAEVPVEVTVH